MKELGDSSALLCLVKLCTPVRRIPLIRDAMTMLPVPGYAQLYVGVSIQASNSGVFLQEADRADKFIFPVGDRGVERGALALDLI